jgi:type IV pilus assembly protein PilQ
VSVAPAAGGGTAVTIHVEAQVDVQHFVLDAPRRVVLDLGGATLMAGAPRYDGAARGGVTNVRAAQYRAGVVRVVVELDGARKYRVDRGADGVQLVVEGGAASFATWHGKSGGASAASAATAAAPAAADAPAAQAAAQTASAPAADAALPAAAPTYDPRPRRATRRPPRTAASAAAAVAAAVAAEEEASMAPRRAAVPARLTVTYQDADIRDVIAAFAAFSGRTIIAGRDVTGTVTAEIKDQPWDVALRALLGSQGLAASEDRNGIIVVDSWKNLATTRSVEPMTTQIVTVNYAKASSLLPIVQTLLTRDCGADAQGGGGGAGAGAQSGVPRGCVVRGAVTADSATNKLLVTDVPSRMGDIFARLKELDVRTPQVAIKAKIVFVNRTGLEDIGVSYDLGTGNDQFFQKVVQRIDPTTRTPVTNADGKVVGMGGGEPFSGDRVSVGGNALSALANADRALAPSALNLIYSATLGRFQLTSFLNALQQTSLADVQSEPSIVTLNNRTAEIFVGQQIPIRVIDASAGGGGGAGGQNFPRATVRLQEAGIRLSVTPQVTNNNKVLLDVRAENSSAQLSTAEVGVVFNQQRAENRLLVGDGETAVIGGLTVTEKSRNLSGIPFLMDLPLVGRLFRQTTTAEVKRDLLILITPHVLDEGEQPPTPQMPGAPRR